MSVKNALEDFARRVQQRARTNLTKAGKKDTGQLYEGTTYELKVHANSFHLSFKMPDYWEYVDKGVQGKTSSSRAPRSPFKFGSGTGQKGGLTKAMEGWVQRHRIQFKDRKTGKFTSYESTAFLIARSIYNKGLPTTEFFSKPFAEEFKKLPEAVVQEYGLEVNKMLTNVFRQ